MDCAQSIGHRVPYSKDGPLWVQNDQDQWGSLTLSQRLRPGPRVAGVQVFALRTPSHTSHHWEPKELLLAWDIFTTSYQKLRLGHCKFFSVC